MSNLTRYPQFNDQQHERPVLSMYGEGPWAEYTWLSFPVVALILTFLLR